jgi:endoribonuclease Dicer
MHTDLNVGMYHGEMGVDFWDPATWKEEIGKHEVGNFHRYFSIRKNRYRVCVFDLKNLRICTNCFLFFEASISNNLQLFIYCFQVLVMTPTILLNGLRHGFLKLSMIKVLIIDECHHASGKHPYALIMTVGYLNFFSFYIGNPSLAS